MAKSHDQKVREWIDERLNRFITSGVYKHQPVEHVIANLKAIAAEASLRLHNPEFPEAFASVDNSGDNGDNPREEKCICSGCGNEHMTPVDYE